MKEQEIQREENSMMHGENQVSVSCHDEDTEIIRPYEAVDSRVITPYVVHNGFTMKIIGYVPEMTITSHIFREEENHMRKTMYCPLLEEIFLPKCAEIDFKSRVRILPFTERSVLRGRYYSTTVRFLVDPTIYISSNNNGNGMLYQEITKLRSDIRGSVRKLMKNPKKIRVRYVSEPEFARYQRLVKEGKQTRIRDFMIREVPCPTKEKLDKIIEDAMHEIRQATEGYFDRLDMDKEGEHFPHIIYCGVNV